MAKALSVDLCTSSGSMQVFPMGKDNEFYLQAEEELLGEEKTLLLTEGGGAFF
jgi:hypothetical protein